jgi:hypothetical protein
MTTQHPSLKWVPHEPNLWPYEYGELIHDITFTKYTHVPGAELQALETIVPAGTTVRISMYSRFGDVGITTNLDREYAGYGTRGIMLSEIHDHLRNLRKNL